MYCNTKHSHTMAWRHAHEHSHALPHLLSRDHTHTCIHSHRREKQTGTTFLFLTRVCLSSSPQFVHSHSLTSYQALYQWPELWTFLPVCRALWKAKNSSSCSSIILMLEHWLFWTPVFWWWKPGAVKLRTFTWSTLHWCILTTHNLNSLPRSWVIYF